MLDCLILGDSLAIGVGQARPACTTAAQSGIGSGGFLQTLFPAAPKQAARVVISLGVNDGSAADTPANLRRLRRGIHADRVTWLLPGLKAKVREAIRTVAAEHGDQVVDTNGEVGPDRLHPGRDGYKRIADRTEQAVTTVAAIPPRRPSVQTPGAIHGTWAVAGPSAAVLPRTYAFRGSSRPIN